MRDHVPPCVGFHTRAGDTADRQIRLRRRERLHVGHMLVLDKQDSFPAVVTSRPLQHDRTFLVLPILAVVIGMAVDKNNSICFPPQVDRGERLAIWRACEADRAPNGQKTVAI